MIFVNARVASGRYNTNGGRYCGRSTCHISGTLSNQRNFNAARASCARRSSSGYQHDDEPASPRENFCVGCIVVCFGVAITLGLILLPLSLCCYSVIRTPFFACGSVVICALLLTGAILRAQQTGCLQLGKPAHFCRGCAAHHSVSELPTTNLPVPVTDSPTGCQRSMKIDCSVVLLPPDVLFDKLTLPINQLESKVHPKRVGAEVGHSLGIPKRKLVCEGGFVLFA